MNVAVTILGVGAITLTVLYILYSFKQYIDDRVKRLAVKNEVLFVCLYLSNKHSVRQSLSEWKNRLEAKSKTSPLKGMELEFYNCTSAFLEAVAEPEGQPTMTEQTPSQGKSDEQSFAE